MTNIETKRKKLYQEFREYQQLSAAEKAPYQEKIRQEALERSEAEKQEYGQAIQENLDEIQERLNNIKAKLDTSTALTV